MGRLGKSQGTGEQVGTVKIWEFWEREGRAFPHVHFSLLHFNYSSVEVCGGKKFLFNTILKNFIYMV